MLNYNNFVKRRKLLQKKNIGKFTEDFLMIFLPFGILFVPYLLEICCIFAVACICKSAKSRNKGII
jgi:hypothetical protein